MAVYAVYEVATGRLDSTTDHASLVDPGPTMAVKVLHVTAWAAGGAWDPVALEFLPRDPPEDPPP